jgi:retinol dehydrogenase-12
VQLNVTAQVFFVTGGYTGIGYELCQILYAHNATVYVAGRSQQKASDAMTKLQNAAPNSKGSLKFLQMDFTDLATVKSGVQTFLSEQDRLHVLVNNAGVSTILLV